MHGNADGARLIGDGTGDGLTDPPRRVRRELEALLVVELLHRLHEAEIALLDEVEKEHPAADIPLGNGDDKAQVGLREALFRRLVPLLHPTGELDLLVPRKQGHPADVLQIHLDGIVEPDIRESLFKQLLVPLVLVEDLDARLGQRLIDLLDLVGAEIVLFQDVAEGVRRNAPLHLIRRDQPVDDLLYFLFRDLFRFCHKSLPPCPSRDISLRYINLFF